MAGAVVVGSVVGMVAAIASGAYYVQQVGLNDEAAAACDAAGNNTHSSLALVNAANVMNTKANTAGSVESSSDALTLLLVSLFFFDIVSWSLVLFRIPQRVAARLLVSGNVAGLWQ